MSLGVLTTLEAFENNLHLRPNHLGNQSPPTTRNGVSKGELVKYHESDGDTLYFHFGLLQLSTFFSARLDTVRWWVETEDMNIMFETFSQNHVFSCLKLEKYRGTMWHSLPSLSHCR